MGRTHPPQRRGLERGNSDSGADAELYRRAARLGRQLSALRRQGRRTNSLLGFDAVWRTPKFRGDKNLLLGGWAAFSRGDPNLQRPQGSRTGWGFRADYPNDQVDCSSTLFELGQALDPALGFLPRPGVRRQIHQCRWQPRPARDGPWSWIRQYFVSGFYERVVNYRGQLESWRYQWSPAGIQFDSGEPFKIEWAPQYEFLPEPFRIAEGVVIPAGPYRFHQVEVDGHTSPHRPLQWVTENTFGSFYSGRLTQLQQELHWTLPDGRWRWTAAAEYDFARLREGTFIQRLWRLEATFAWNAYIVLSSFVQYDSESENLGMNTRLRWTFQPGNDLFVIWNRGWQRWTSSPRDLLLRPDSEMLAVKLRWTFRP